MARPNSTFKSPLYPSPNCSNYYSSSRQSTAAKADAMTVPVRFFDSHKNVTRGDPSNAATKIQKVFRGFLARNNLITVRKIEEEVNEIELKFKRDADIDRIFRVEKERLQIGEMLMRLLFRLDSVRGVRDYRKKVIGRVISIQEVLDSFSSSNLKPEIEEAKSLIAKEANDCDDQMTESLSAEITDQDVEDGIENMSGSSDEDMANSVDLSECKNHDDEMIDSGWEFLEIDDADSGGKNEKQKIDDEDDGELQNVSDVNGKFADNEHDNKRQKMAFANEKLKEENEKMMNIVETMKSEKTRLKNLVAELCKNGAQQYTLMREIWEKVVKLEKTVKKMKKNKKYGKIKEMLEEHNLQ